MTKTKFLTAFFLFLPFYMAAQHDHNGHNHSFEHEHDEEHQHIHEIGVSVGPAYFINADEFSVATHFHYVYNFPESRFGLGIGYERIFDEHKHSFVGLEFNFRPVHQLTVSVSPGIVSETEEKRETDFGVHFEVVYEKEFGAFHIGPMVELARHPEDWHITTGIHVGLGL